ncbi:MAG: VOC family protein [Thermomicrobiales bacterium]|nr:VOC family protein [Thermomicrobiales bacterium]
MPTVKRLQHTSVPMPPGGDDRARAFYGDMLNMREIPKPTGLKHLTVVWFAANDEGDEVHVFQEQNMGPNSAAQHLCLEVDDLEAFRTRLHEGGYDTQNPEVIGNRPRLFVRDPFGNLVELVQILGQYT